MASTPWYQGLSLYVMSEYILENFIPQVNFSLSHTLFTSEFSFKSTRQPSKGHIHYTSNGLRAQKLTIILVQVPFHFYTLSSWEENKDEQSTFLFFL